MAAGKKRQLEESAAAPKPKKTKVASADQKEKRDKKAGADKPLKAATKAAVNASVTAPEEVDFPRGGGSSLTPFEIKTVRAEAVKEANDELFKVCIYTLVISIYNSLCHRRTRRNKNKRSRGESRM